MQITNDIKYIGVNDHDIDLFEGQYVVKNGMAYNSYVIIDDKIAVMDTVDTHFEEEWLENLKDVLVGRTPDYLIVQHMEPDHSASIRAMLERYPETKVVATARAMTMLDNFFDGIDLTDRRVIVADGDTLSLGNTTLRFITAPMVHWPEVMVTLDETDGVLFSADAFGSFAMSEASDAWTDEARRYYCNIVGKYGPSVQALIKKLSSLQFGIIAPLHGPVLTDNLARYCTLYDKWSRYEPECNGTLVAYASIYGGTAEAACRLAAELEKRDAGEVVLMDLCRNDVSYAVAEAFRLSRLALCSVTYDCYMFPAMHTFLHHLEMKNFRNRPFAIIENGSWAPVAGKHMCEALGRMKGMTQVAPVVTIHSRMHNADLCCIGCLADALAKA